MNQTRTEKLKKCSAALRNRIYLFSLIMALHNACTQKLQIANLLLMHSADLRCSN